MSSSSEDEVDDELDISSFNAERRKSCVYQYFADIPNERKMRCLSENCKQNITVCIKLR
jgi:hypothetical protein